MFNLVAAFHGLQRIRHDWVTEQQLKFLRYNSGSKIISQNVLIFRRCMLKYLGVKCYNV